MEVGSKCHNGHILVKRCLNSSYTCDICNECLSKKRNVKIYGWTCDTCVYDVCNKCYGAASVIVDNNKDIVNAIDGVTAGAGAGAGAIATRSVVDVSVNGVANDNHHTQECISNLNAAIVAPADVNAVVINNAPQLISFSAADHVDAAAIGDTHVNSSQGFINVITADHVDTAVVNGNNTQTTNVILGGVPSSMSREFDNAMAGFVPAKSIDKYEKFFSIFAAYCAYHNVAIQNVLFIFVFVFI